MPASCLAALSPFCRAAFPEQQSQDLFPSEQEVIQKASFGSLKMLDFFMVLLHKQLCRFWPGVKRWLHAPFYW